MKTLADLQAEHQIAEKRLVRAALTLNRWNGNATARQLGVSSSTLVTTMRRLGLLDEFRERSNGPGRPRKMRIGEAP